MVINYAFSIVFQRASLTSTNHLVVKTILICQSIAFK